MWHSCVFDESMNLLGTYLPDYCNGNLYSLRPSVGLALAEGARSVFHHYHAEDLFITGLVAEQLPAVSLKSLSHLGPSQLWDGVLAHCPLIGFLRWGINKSSERSDSRYVPSPQVRLQPPGPGVRGGGQHHPVRQQSHVFLLHQLGTPQLSLSAARRPLHGVSKPHLFTIRIKPMACFPCHNLNSKP